MSALTLGLIAALCWGIHDVTIRKISQNTPLMATLFGVLVVGGVFQLGILTATAGFASLPETAIWYSVLAGVGFLLASTCLYFAFQRGPVRIVAPVIGSYPVLSVGWAVTLGETVTALQWMAVLTIVAGIAIVAVFAGPDDREDGPAIPPVGPTFLLSALSAIGFFTTFAFGHEAAKMGDEMSSILLTRITAIVTMLPVFVVFGQRIWPGRAALPFIAVMGVLDGIALLCVISAGSLPSSQYAAVASSVFGLITVILAWAILREPMTRWQWGGCALAFAGIGYLAL